MFWKEAIAVDLMAVDLKASARGVEVGSHGSVVRMREFQHMPWYELPQWGQIDPPAPTGTTPQRLSYIPVYPVRGAVSSPRLDHKEKNFAQDAKQNSLFFFFLSVVSFTSSR